MPTLKKRVDIIWITTALLVSVGGGVALARASSSGGDDTGAPAGRLQLAAASDAALTSRDPSDREAAARLAYATGVEASDPAAAPQTWPVGDSSVLGYSASSGRFCFEFRSLGGGCLEPGVLTNSEPIDLTVDYWAGTLRVYGLVLDGVTAVSVDVGGSSRPAAFAHNAFYFSDDALGGNDGVAGDVVATMSDGGTREAPFHVGSLNDLLPSS